MVQHHLQLRTKQKGHHSCCEQDDAHDPKDASNPERFSGGHVENLIIKATVENLIIKATKVHKGRNCTGREASHMYGAILRYAVLPSGAAPDRRGSQNYFRFADDSGVMTASDPKNRSTQLSGFWFRS